MTMYSMNHKWDGIYCLHSIAVAYVPRDHCDLFGVANVLNILLNIKVCLGMYVNCSLHVLSLCSSLTFLNHCY
jgi:hypothetical protein